MEPQPSDDGGIIPSNPDRAVTTSEFANMFDNLITRMRRIFELPNVVAESVLEDSLARNEAVLGNTKIPSTSQGINSHLQPDTENRKKVKTDDSRSEDAVDDNSRVAPGDKLGKHELTIIFSSSKISTRDLLNFRVVSKRWRDAATISLCQRDACIVELDARPVRNRPRVYKKEKHFTGEHTLSELTKLISMSPKFPATDFRIYIARVCITPYTDFPDLLRFFKLHGEKIKTLRHFGSITTSCLLDIFKNVPSLEHLDLSDAIVRANFRKSSNRRNALIWKDAALKTITLGLFGYYSKPPEPSKPFVYLRIMSAPVDRSHQLEFLQLLLSSPPKLSSIENVTLRQLQILLREGKENLIRNFNFHISDAECGPASQLSKLISLNPKPNLSKITLNLRGEWPSSFSVKKSLNPFLKSVKDTVQSLKLVCDFNQYAWPEPLKILPMKNLKSFTLKLRTYGEVKAEDFQFLFNIRRAFFHFQSRILAQNYFPNLMEVQLHSTPSEFNEVSLISFFLFEYNQDLEDGSFANFNCLPTVKSLKINRIEVGSRPITALPCPSSTKTSLIPHVFPNIQTLKFKCGEVRNLSSHLWTICPNVAIIEIYGIARCSSGGRDVEMSHLVDTAFTGYSERMLENLQRSATGILSKADDSEELKSALRTPAISDLKHLKELNLKFVGNWFCEFASSATGLYAFSKMQNTTFFIFHDPKENASGFKRAKVGGNPNPYVDEVDEIAKYEELIFGSLKPYARIVHEVKKNDFRNV